MSYAVRFMTRTRVVGNKELPQSFVRHFGSIMEVREWAEYNNYVLGEAHPLRATYEIEHADGSPLSDSELQRLQPRDSETTFIERQRGGEGYRFGGV